jgi:murein DD-endopeptidase MepM/ murein hydrolase activator NlpD
MVVPDQTQKVRKLVVPAWAARTLFLIGIFTVLLAAMMLINYWFVMNQISENKELRLENRKLKQQVQVYKNKSDTIESTLERIKTFTTRLKVITNIEDKGDVVKNLNTLPDANSNIAGAGAEVAALQAQLFPNESPTEEERALLQRDYLDLTHSLDRLERSALTLEQIVQDQTELLADKKSFLAALPTRKPAEGYFTSGFGVRRSPFGGGPDKMHEGLDIANAPGTSIFATADGVVAHADVRSGYGQLVVIDHGYGLETWYGHNRKILVTRGQKIRRGEIISQLGTSGRSTGPHLHYEVRVRGTPVDPLAYILEN